MSCVKQKRRIDWFEVDNNGIRINFTSFHYISNNGAVNRPLFPNISLIMHAPARCSLAAAVAARSSLSSHTYSQRAHARTNHHRAFEIGHHNICNMARRRGSWFCLRKKCHLYRLKSWPIDLQTPQDGLSHYVVGGSVLFWWQIRVTATVEWQVVGRFFVAMADWHFASVYPKW